MANSPNPSVKAGENTDIITARREAAAKLLPLFGGKTADGNEVVGVFHLHGIAAVIGASADNAAFVAALQKNQTTRDLATFASAHGHPKFPPALVAEFLARPEAEESNDWFAEVYLGGLREIFLATCSPGKNDGVGLMLQPARAGIDHLKAALNVFDHLTDEEAKKLGLFKPEKAVRQEFPGDLLGMAEFEPATFTAAQRLYRWAVKKWREREEWQAEKDTNKATVASATDPAAALPPAPPPAPKPALEPAPAPPAEPVIPDLSALTGGPAPATLSRTLRASRKAAAAVPAVPVVAPLPAPLPAPPAETPEPAAPAALTAAEDNGRKLLLDVVKATAGDDKNVNSIYAKAFLLLAKGGETASVKELESFINRRNLLR